MNEIKIFGKVGTDLYRQIRLIIESIIYTHGKNKKPSKSSLMANVVLTMREL